jgi:hypothetical protein
MSQYLEEAAALLRKAQDANEKENGISKYPASAANPGRERIAAQFAVLAAIEAGVLPTELARALARQTGWNS